MAAQHRAQQQGAAGQGAAHDIEAQHSTAQHSAAQHSAAGQGGRGHIVVVGGQKGGTGKSTLAFNLAVMMQRHGWKTLIVDSDPQGTISKVAGLRSEVGVQPHIPCVEKLAGAGATPRSLSKDIAGLADQFDVVIVDVGGFDSERRSNPEMRGTLLIADTFLIPVHPTPIDAWSVDDVITTIRHAREARAEIAENQGLEPKPLACLTVHSKTSTNPGERDAMVAMARASHLDAAGDEITDSGCVIGNRKVFAMSIIDGLGAIEGGDSKAIQEMLRLFRAVTGFDFMDVVKYPNLRPQSQEGGE